MGAAVFEVGLYKPAVDGVAPEPEMLPRTWPAETLLRSVSWLKFQNQQGRNIYIRPNGEHSLTLVDDLTADMVKRMCDEGFNPAIVLETSPGNFQAWLNHGRTLPKDVSSAAARAVAARFDADPGSADWRHFGRLAGYTNRKIKHQMPDGRFPFVRLVYAECAAVYPIARDFVASIESELAARRAEAVRRHASMRGAPRNTQAKTITDFRTDSKYGGDGNRIDLAYAVYALSHGVSVDDVRTAIAGRDLSHKGNSARQTDYIERTLRKALAASKDRGCER